MIRPPAIPIAPAQYDQRFFEAFFNELRQYFARANVPYDMNAATLNINYSLLPTEAALASLNSGSVYRDTTDNHALKVKP